LKEEEVDKGAVKGMGCENCAFLGYYVACGVNPLSTFQDNLSVPSSRVKKSKKDS